MNTRFLETLVWLTRLRSFGRTAEKLNTTQPAVSNRINKLEELLGVKLYDRSAKQFELTPAGRRVLRYAEDIVAMASELHEAAVNHEDVDTKLRIGVIEIATMSWLPAFLERIAEAFPKASFEIGAGTSGQLVEKLRDDRMDLVFVVGPVNEPHIMSHPICNVGLDWLANPDRFDCDSEIDLVELSRLPVVLQGSGASGYDILIEYFRGYGITNVPANDSKLVIDCIYSLGTAMQVVRTGLGIMGLPTFLFADDIAAGRVRRMKVRQKLPPFYITACCKQPMTNRLIERLIEIAVESAREHAASFDPGDVSA